MAAADSVRHPRPEAAPGRAADADGQLVVVVGVGDLRCALVGERVVEVVPIAWFDPLPGAPPHVAGVLDLRGIAVPVIDLGRRFGGAPRPVSLDDRLVVVDTATRRLALHVGPDVELIEALPDDLLPSHVPEATTAFGFVVTADGLVVIHDVEALLTSDDERVLEAALADRVDGDR